MLTENEYSANAGQSTEVGPNEGSQSVMTKRSKVQKTPIHEITVVTVSDAENTKSPPTRITPTSHTEAENSFKRNDSVKSGVVVKQSSSRADQKIRYESNDSAMEVKKRSLNHSPSLK